MPLLDHERKLSKSYELYELLVQHGFFGGKNVFQAYSEISCIKNSGNTQASSNPSLPN